MEFYSILYESQENEMVEQSNNNPDVFTDLNLDQIINEILVEKDEYNLSTFFYHNLKTPASINYRLEVMKDLENEQLFNSILTFSYEMLKVREFAEFSLKLHNKYQREKWLLDAINLYCTTILKLNKALSVVTPNSKGLQLFNNWLNSYINSSYFILLSEETKELLKRINSIKYSIEVDSEILTVTTDEDEKDYCAQFNSTFDKINEAKFDYSISFFTDLELCVLETKILDIVKDFNIEVFESLGAYAQKHVHFLDKTVKAFDREIQFYVSYIQYISKLKKRGFNFSYPNVSYSKKINIIDGYDLALAYKCRDSQIDIINNDFGLDNEERICILTGPNQGGKTTFARAFGQIAFLASIGCPVPCRKADTFIFDNIFTHFAVEENLSTNTGRLKEELVRIKIILGKATTNSIIIINELFATTTSYDAYTMGKRILDWFIEKDCICLYVTHIYELIQISKKIVSLVAIVNSDERSSRTYKIVRRPADGIAYANSIVEKYNLTYAKIKERMSI